MWKKIISFLLVAIFWVLPVSHTYAQELPENPIDLIAVDLLESAIQHNQYFNLPDIQGEPLYVCNPIHPFCIEENELVENDDIAYYLIRTSNQYIACITLCYEKGEIISASFSTDIAEILERYNVGSEYFLLVAYDGALYVKTETAVHKGSQEESMSRSAVETDSICCQISDTEGSMARLTNMYEIQLTAAYDIMPRSSRVLSVPYVSQGNYDICWAAAAAALGRYYTGDTYSQYSAYELACMVGVGTNGASMSAARNLLSSIFKVNTTYVNGQMDKSTIAQYINMNRPILVGFSNSSKAHMVVLCGYDDGGNGENMKYYVRDSNSSSLQIVVTYSSGRIGMDYYSSYGIMYWREAAYKG